MQSVQNDKYHSSPCILHSRVSSTAQVWQRQQKKGIWLQLPVSKAGMLLEPALQQGFTFHHAEQSYLQLTRWLPSTENKLPANASHQAGICCASCWTLPAHCWYTCRRADLLWILIAPVDCLHAAV